MGTRCEWKAQHLISYLQSLRSSDINKVEVQTVADASQDANVQGGVINIVLRKQKDNGVNGSIENRLNVAQLHSSAILQPFRCSQGGIK